MTCCGLCSADKRRAVETLLRDDEWRRWSDRTIAERCGVGHQLVAHARAELRLDDSSSRPDANPPKRISADGRERPATQPKREVATHQEAVDDGSLLLDGARSHLCSGRDGEVAALDGGYDFGGGVAEDGLCGFDGASADAERLRCIGGRGSADLRILCVLVRALRKRRDPRCHHRPLAFVQVPAVQVQREHEADRVVPFVVAELGLDAGGS